MSRGILVRGGEIVTHERAFRGDIRCREGVIVEIGEGLDPESDESIDATGLKVFPGGVDPHVHMSLPVAGTVLSDDFESGTAAGLTGGTTSIVDFVHPERGQSFTEALLERRREAEVAVADYGLHMAVTWWGDGVAEEMGTCVERGLPTFKLYMAYKDTVGLVEDDLVAAMATVSSLDAMVIVHAEHGEAIEYLRTEYARSAPTEPRSHALSRPSTLEGEATHRITSLAGVLGTPLYVVHVTCRESVDAIRRAQAAGWRVRGETCPQYLLLDDSVYDKPDFEGAAYVIAPPIRPREHQEVLWEALIDDTLEVVATDHCPFNLIGQKDLGRDDFRCIPGGAAGIEHRLSLLWTHGVVPGRIDERRFVQLVSTAPAKRFGLYPRKGAITVGADADLVLWDPRASGTISATTHHHHCDRSIYEGFETRGAAVTVIGAGEVRFADGALRVEPGAGRFLERRLPGGGYST